MKDKIFGVLQRVGRSFMLPIAILPVSYTHLDVYKRQTYDDIKSNNKVNSTQDKIFAVYESQKDKLDIQSIDDEEYNMLCSI